jgi:hypothetical protein
LEECNSVLLQGIHRTMVNSHLQELATSVATIIDDDAVCPSSGKMTQMQICCCIKPGVNAFLDASRASFNELSENLQGQVLCLTCSAFCL